MFERPQIVRIPLTIVAPLGKTDGVIVAVAVSDLDALEAENERLQLALGARSTEADLIWIEHSEDLRALMGTAASLLSQLGGMLPGTKTIVDTVIELLTVDEPDAAPSHIEQGTGPG